MGRFRNSNLIAVLMTMLSLTTLGLAGQPGPTPANWGQGQLQNWPCPPSHETQEIFTPIPFPVAITTTGGPLLIVMSLATSVQNTGDVHVRLLVDGQPTGMEFTRTDLPYVDFITFTHMLAVPAGAHSVGVTMACVEGLAVLTVRQGYLSVYELPTIPK